MEDILSLIVAMVTVVDSQERGLCVEAKYSLLEFSVPFSIIDRAYIVICLPVPLNMT